jgi:hypothetical protein
MNSSTSQSGTGVHAPDANAEPSGFWREKPVVIAAYRFENKIWRDGRPQWLLEAVKHGVVYFENRGAASQLLIKALGGTMRANLGDYIIQGVSGEIYPCKPDIFAATYEPADVPETPPSAGESK